MISSIQRCGDSGPNPLESCTDEQLCALAAEGEAEAETLLVIRYTVLVRACARPLFLAGGDSEDLIQEGMVGLLTAIRHFRPDRDASFRTYAEICIRSRLLTAVRAARGGKHTPLNESVPFETSLFDRIDPTLQSPEDVVIGREEFRERLEALRGRLSPLEARILPPYLNGLSCGEIAREQGLSPKSVDNAIQRIRRKMARQFSSGVTSES